MTDKELAAIESGNNRGDLDYGDIVTRLVAEVRRLRAEVAFVRADLDEVSRGRLGAQHEAERLAGVAREACDVIERQDATPAWFVHRAKQLRASIPAPDLGPLTIDPVKIV